MFSAFVQGQVVLVEMNGIVDDFSRTKLEMMPEATVQLKGHAVGRTLVVVQFFDQHGIFLSQGIVGRGQVEIFREIVLKGQEPSRKFVRTVKENCSLGRVVGDDKPNGYRLQ